MCDENLWAEEVNALKRDALRRVLEITAAIEWRTLQGRNADELREERAWFQHLYQVLARVGCQKGEKGDLCNG